MHNERFCNTLRASGLGEIELKEFIRLGIKTKDGMTKFKIFLRNLDKSPLWIAIASDVLKY